MESLLNDPKELSRRIFYCESEGMACGPIGYSEIHAEIVVELDGQIYYLHGEYVDGGDGECAYEATCESLYDILKQISSLEGDVEEKIGRDRDTPVHEPALAQDLEDLDNDLDNEPDYNAIFAHLLDECVRIRSNKVPAQVADMLFEDAYEDLYEMIRYEYMLHRPECDIDDFLEDNWDMR